MNMLEGSQNQRFVMVLLLIILINIMMKDNMFEGSQYPQFDMVLLLTGMDMAR